MQYCVGGMGCFWSCAIPRYHSDLEQSSLLSVNEWDVLYKKSEQLLRLSTDVFNDSIRHYVVKTTISTLLPDRQVQDMPLAVQKNAHNEDLVNWVGPNMILGDELLGLLKNPQQENFMIKVFNCNTLTLMLVNMSACMAGATLVYPLDSD